MTSVLMKLEKRGHTDTKGGHHVTAEAQPRNAKDCWQCRKLGEKLRQNRSSSRAFRRTQSCRHPDFELQTSRTMKHCISVVYSQSICGSLLVQPSK